MILKLAKVWTTPINTEFMKPDKMHCTSHAVVEWDSEYEETWFSGVENESVKFDKIFWTENVCVLCEFEWTTIAVLFNDRRECSPPICVECHKAAVERFRGFFFFFVKKCLQATDWVEVDKDIAQSKSVGAF